MAGIHEETDSRSRETMMLYTGFGTDNHKPRKSVNGLLLGASMRNVKVKVAMLCFRLLGV